MGDSSIARRPLPVPRAPAVWAVMPATRRPAKGLRPAVFRQSCNHHRRIGEALSQANKLSRTYTLLLDALNRHRGKGQQKVTVEHVHVHSGGQAIVGTVQTSALEKSSKTDGQYDAKQIAHAPQPPMRSPNAEPELVPSASDAERPLPDARRNVARSPEGQ